MLIRLVCFCFVLVGCGSQGDGSGSETSSTKTVNTKILKTAQTITYIVGDDASYSKGEQRSYIRDDLYGYVIDNTLDLMWQDSYEDNNDTIKRAKLTDAVSYCQSLTLGGFNDWRLPYFNEAVNLYEYDSEFMLLDNSFTTQSTGYVLNSHYNEDRLYEMIYAIPFLIETDISFHGESEFAVRCVRGPEYAGKFKRNNAEEIVVDEGTLLQWQDNAVVNSILKDFNGAIDYCENLTLSNYSDWRLPNQNELYSLVDNTKYGPVIYDAFTYVGLDDMTWSSTSLDEDSAVAIHFFDGQILPPLKSDLRHIRCVRN